MTDRSPTLADLCSAIAEGQIVAAIDGSMYSVNMRELRRYFNKLRSLSTLSSIASISPLAASIEGLSSRNTSFA